MPKRDENGTCRAAWRILALALTMVGAFAQSDPPEARPPQNEGEKRFWLQNMVWHHQFTHAEVTAATGLTEAEIVAALDQFHISEATRPRHAPGSPLLVLPYPGARHPRIGFLEGAVRPQRETKFSVFCPWEQTSYVVVDLPEAIWSHLGLTYLAHTHVPTIWTRQQVALPQMEWERLPNQMLRSERTLPNGIAFGAKVIPAPEGVRMSLWLRNGTSTNLTDLRVQICVMLKGASGFAQQTADNKLIAKPYVACHTPDRSRWVITAWAPCDRPWTNPPVPCLHSDPKFPDCPPGETKWLRGWLSFYQGTNIQAELRRLDTLDWRSRP